MTGRAICGRCPEGPVGPCGEGVPYGNQNFLKPIDRYDMIIVTLSHYEKTSLADCDFINKGDVTDRVNDEPPPDFEFGLAAATLHAYVERLYLVAGRRGREANGRTGKSKPMKYLLAVVKKKNEKRQTCEKVTHPPGECVHLCSASSAM
ncbi:hypothetical protein EYF80_031066 [Liparis tanakae]|uniref:Uncharacterized protein n=1 Tax=Liparis tanakae TaxID=230148 RepID=A0A4Z2GZJ8_9TELE|nr:hypothetical protein EYF80_031066 [Liparis tanakae]